jgi:hypothetical protein
MRWILVVMAATVILVAGCISGIPFIGDSGPPSFMTKCTSDSDCVPTCALKDCCCTCKDTAINKKYLAEWNYGNEKYCQSQSTSCTASACGHISNPLCISENCIINKTAVEQP